MLIFWHNFSFAARLNVVGFLICGVFFLPNYVQFLLAKGSTSTRLNFGMCQNVKPVGPFACLCCFCKHAWCQLCKMSPSAWGWAGNCTLSSYAWLCWSPFVIAKRDYCNSLHWKIKSLAKSIDLKGEMEVFRELSGLTGMQTKNAWSNANKRHVCPIAASWLLHEHSSTNLTITKTKTKPKKPLVLLNRFGDIKN